MKIQESQNTNKPLSTFSIWAIGVGMVISGESFGWNFGWAITGPIWFFVPVFIAAILYFGLVQTLLELACVYPQANGPQDYVKKAFGEKAGAFIAVAILLEFLFATPAIASSLGEYLGFLLEDLSISPYISTGFLVLFFIINLFDLHIGVKFLITLTILAILELLIYQGTIAASFNTQNLSHVPFGGLNFENFLAALPYAIWLFLAIEGISLMTKNLPQNKLRKTLGRGYYFAFFTLLVLAILVLLLAAGGINWSNKENLSILEDNHPMPASMALILGKENVMVTIFTFIGLFGLIASLQGITLAATTQLEQLLPEFNIQKTSKRFLSSLIVFLISVAAIWLSQTNLLIEISVFGAVCMYLAVSISLFFLRENKLKSLAKKTPNHYYHSDFNYTISTVFTFSTAFISILCIWSFAKLQTRSFFIFIIFGIVYVILNNKKTNGI
ncbi:amino acid permease [Lacihabitans lacunae]|uniref:Amino acid permease n=1 Tax=Lacihabitans lacunae TaxID=1028214 RepID=A0ABV7Z4H1_9BACT